MNEDDDAQRKLRRLQKFSSTARDRIINDPLTDRALLSRSASSNLDGLLNSQRLREQLLQQLKAKRLEATKDDAQIEHGLRKLREVIVSVSEQHKSDSQFIKFSLDVYKMSYDFYLSKREYQKLGNLVLAFMATKLPSELTADYRVVYVLHLSHIENNMGKCIKMIELEYGRHGRIDDMLRKLLRLSLIYTNHTECPSEWFKLLASFPVGSPVYEFLRPSPAYAGMLKRCLVMVGKCYNQISTGYLLEGWLHNFLEKTELSHLYHIRQTPKGNEIIDFKEARRS